MPFETLPDMAPELLIQILKSLDSFADVTSLSSTCRKMFVIWKRNDHAICHAILARTVSCFAQAQEFSDAQEKAEGDKQPDSGHWPPVERAHRMLKWADTITKACSYFEIEVFGLWALSECPAERKTLTLAEKMDFIRAYYRSTTFATLGKDSISDDLMSSWDMMELGQLKDVTRFVLYHCNHDRQQELGVCFKVDHSKPWPIGLTSNISWMYLDAFIQLMETVLYRHTSKAEQGSKTSTRHFPSILRGRYPEEYRPNGGARLADVFKRMTKRERRLFSPRFKLPANETTSCLIMYE